MRPIEKIRNAMNLSQEDFGSQILFGITQGAVGHKESGIRPITIKEAKNIRAEMDIREIDLPYTVFQILENKDEE